ncbi:MAG TPA: parallel beta-helix domain-containing protein [Solimonas sp.]|nr:parallel beta-helix domain-containing protein [Solimonas sp.]
MNTRPWLAAACVLAALALSGCGSSEPAFGGGGRDAAPAPVPGPGSTKTYRICPGPDAQKETLIAFFDAHEGDVIEFCEGQFSFDTGLIMTGKRGVTIRGAGRDKTYLRFDQSTSQDGISINQVDGITLENLTVYDAPGNGVRVFRSKYVTFRGVRIGWSNADPATPYGNYDASMDSWSNNGAYAFYPVVCRHVLIEDSISVGSSDAGVYIGQSSDILVRRTEAFHNVAGFEFENTYRAEYIDNIAHDNVGGFLVFDLPGRVQFGEKNLVHHNKSYDNNIPQFAPRGSIVAVIPPGTGMLVAAADQVRFEENEIYNNKTVGLAIVNYGLADSGEPATNYDFFPEGISVSANTFRDNGYLPALPDNTRNTCIGGPGIPVGLPGPSDDPSCIGDNATILPLILLAKNAGRSAHIIWDGGIDVPSDCAKVPVDRDGIPLNQPNPNETSRPEPRTDERGRPNLYQFDPIPECKWNGWKFDAAGALNLPANGMCVEDSNTFENSTAHPEGALVSDFANVHFATADPTDPANLVPADNTPPKDCPTVPTPLLSQFVPVLPAFVPNPNAEPRPSEAQIAAACGGGTPGAINYPAVLGFNCPKLSDYGLYVDEQDPRRGTLGHSMPFELNTALFSDYASKYRYLILPPGANAAPAKALFQDHDQCETLNVFDCYSQALKFPVGTVFSKTFTFKDGAAEDVVETRLLIKRQHAAGDVYWVGLPYLWQTGSDGRRVAVLKIEGDHKRVTYNYDDPDPDARDASGNRPHYEGTVETYGIPNAGACVLCHNGDDLEAGAPPIGPKIRNLNRDADIPGTGQINQLAYMQSRGFIDLPGAPETLEKLARVHVPGSSGAAADSPEDVHKRARAFMEVNCYHCHNPAGNAQNSGLVLDSFTEPMRQRQGICKTPIAAGRAADFGTWDIEPGNAAQSILVARVTSTEAGIRMPPLARTVMQREVVDLLTHWVTDVVGDYAFPDDNFCGAGGGGTLPIPLMRPVPPTAAQTAPFG